MTTALTRFQSHYVARKALFKLLGNAFRIHNTDGSLAFYVKQKAFKLKEDITVFADEGEKDAVLRIKARSALDFSATYDVTEVATGENVGALQRKGLKSILRDEWAILDASGAEIGKVQEDSAFLAIVRRFLSNLVPQSFTFTIGDVNVGAVKQHFNPFRVGYDVDFSAGAGKLDPRLGVAAVVMLLAIEGRQA
ncbi:MAG: hypothetical protein JNM72_13795 [Deltaproteobacteria bacterium]|jgi:uncharacterized protein YxjI|nr:hypothetical protein [Deltaproteobacteria bacterium]